MDGKEFLERNIFAQADTVEQVVGQAIGYGSVCWESVSSDDGVERVFQPEEAERAIEHAMQRIKELGFIALPTESKVEFTSEFVAETSTDVNEQLKAQRASHRRMSNLEKAKRFAREGDLPLAESYATIAIAEQLSALVTHLTVSSAMTPPSEVEQVNAEAEEVHGTIGDWMKNQPKGFA